MQTFIALFAFSAMLMQDKGTFFNSLLGLPIVTANQTSDTSLI